MKLAVGFRAEKKITLKLKESNQSFKPNCGEVHKVVEYIGGDVSHVFIDEIESTYFQTEAQLTFSSFSQY